MKNYIAEGDVVNVTAPDDTDHVGGNSGDGVLVGSLFGVAVNDFEAGGDVSIKTKGVFELTKAASQAWTVGQKIYWDDTNLECTSTSSGNTLIGVAYEAAESGAALVLGKVKLGIVA